MRKEAKEAKKDNLVSGKAEMNISILKHQTSFKGQLIS